MPIIIHQGWWWWRPETGETVVGVANLIMLSQQTDNGTYGSWSWLIGKNHNEEYYYYYWASSGDLPLSVGVVVALLMLGKQCLVPVHI